METVSKNGTGDHVSDDDLSYTLGQGTYIRDSIDDLLGVGRHCVAHRNMDGDEYSTAHTLSYGLRGERGLKPNDS